MTRRDSRESALCLLYEYACNREKEPEQLLADYPELAGRNPSAFARTLFLGVCENWTQIDQLIGEAADNWRLDRIGRVSLAILRMSTYELLYCQDIGSEITINEALELTRLYDDEKAVPFVNGVLGKIINK